MTYILNIEADFLIPICIS